MPNDSRRWEIWFFGTLDRGSPRDPPHEDATMVSEPTLSSLAQLAASTAATQAASEQATASAGESGKTKEQLRWHYVHTLHKVDDEADVVLLVLDARDPAGCRSRLVEEEVRRREAEGKRLVFVLNKIGTRARTNSPFFFKVGV